MRGCLSIGLLNDDEGCSNGRLGTSLRALLEATYRDVKASGIRLRVTQLGEGPTLLLLHTTFLSRECWTRCIEILAPHFRLVAVDLPGFGESEKPSESRFGYDISAFTHVIADLYAGLGLVQADVVGHGLGGAVAVALAARHPELVRRLVGVAPQLAPPPRDLVRSLATTPVFGGFAFKQLWSRPLFLRYMRERMMNQRSWVEPKRIEDYYDAFNTPSARNSALSTLRGTKDARGVVADIARLTMPSLFVWGRHDVVHPASEGRGLIRHVPGASFQLLDCGHCPPEEKPEELSQALYRFCSQP